MTKSFISMAVVLFFAILGAAPGAFGQGGATGAINGTVLDTNGGSIADAEVQIVRSSTEEVVRKMNTGPDGTFEATLLPPGTYYAVVNKSGFSEAKALGIDVRVTETTRVTIPLKPGTVSEKIEITAQVASVETTNATTGQAIEARTRYETCRWRRRTFNNC